MFISLYKIYFINKVYANFSLYKLIMVKRIRQSSSGTRNGIGMFPFQIPFEKCEQSVPNIASDAKKKIII